MAKPRDRVMHGQTTWSSETAASIIDSHKGMKGPLLPILHALLEEFGYIDAAAIPLLAQALNVTRADIHGVLSFYHDFRTSPPGRHVVRLCRAESCQSMGAVAVEAHAKRRLAVDFGETTADGEFTLEPVYCLGNCALSPAVMVDDHLYGRVDAERLDAILANHAKPAIEDMP